MANDPEIKHIITNGASIRSSSKTVSDTSYTPLIILSNGWDFSFDNNESPHPSKKEPDITFNVLPWDASPSRLIGKKFCNHSNGLEITSLLLDKVKRISVTSSINRPIESFPSGDKIPGFWNNARSKASKDTNNISPINPENRFLVNRRSSSLVFDNENIEYVDIITAAKISGIAGKDISWISVSPRVLRLPAALGRNKPKTSDSGRIKNRNDFRDRSFFSKFLNEL